MVGPHQASSIRSTSAPSRSAGEDAVAGVGGAPTVHVGARSVRAGTARASPRCARSRRCRGSRRAGRGRATCWPVVLDDDAGDTGRPRRPGRAARCRAAPARRRRRRPCAQADRRGRCPSRSILRPRRHRPRASARTILASVSGPRSVRMPQADLAEVGLRDDQVGRRLGVRRVQVLQLVAEEAGVERHRLDAAPARPGRRGSRAGSRRSRAPRRSAAACGRAGSPSPRARGR